ncbi:MAG TPA: TonB-dependent receptor [Gammaproteobacteria bacterium]|nr:TonB-dependent receptor [Gammaproteobacteria bacterium]
MIETITRPRAARFSPLALAIAASLGVGSVPVLAQQQQQGSGLEEILVTARYREENVQTTPISISAFSGEELEVRSIENVQDIGQVVPNAYFRRNVSNFGPNNTIGLRGLNQVDFSYAFEPTVGVYIDDVYHSTITGSDMDLIDLERVEVLRGPQGTLFGKNSIGGAIRLISKKPQGDNSGSVQATFGDYDRVDLRGIGDFALVQDKVFLRVVGTSKRTEGFGESLDFTCEMIRRGTPQLAGLGDGLGFGGTTADGPDFDSEPDLLAPIAVPVGSAADNAFSLPAARDIKQDGTCALGKLGGTSSEAGKLMLRFVPTDKLDITISAERSSSDDDPNVDTQLSPISNATDNSYDTNVVFRRYGIHYANGDPRMISGNPYTNFATFADPVHGQTYPRNSVMDTRGWSAVFDYQIGDNVGAKLIIADRGYDSEWTNDSDRTPFGITQTHYIQNHDEEQQELQFNGTLLNDKLGWTAGLFHFESVSRAYNTTEFEAFNYTGALANFTANDGYTTDNDSAFVHVSFDLTQKLRLSGGLRYTDEAKTNTFDHGPALNRSDVPLIFGDSRTDWKASIDYSLSEKIFLYVQAATGFTSEGATPRIFTVGQLMALPGEELLSEEIGAKFTLLDDKLRLNVAVFQSDYDPRIRQTGGVTQCDAPTNLNPVPYRLGTGGVCPAGTFFAGSTGLPWFYYDNAPGKLDGYEAELTVTPVENLLVNFSFGYNHYENNNLNPTSPTYVNPDFLAQPAYTSSLGLQYDFHFGGGGRLTPRVDAFYQSERDTGVANADPRWQDTIANVCPHQCIPAYTTFNARLTYQPPDASWRLAIAGTNVTDKFYWQQYSAEYTVNNATGAINTAPFGRSGVASAPRMWSLQVEKSF